MPGRSDQAFHRRRYVRIRHAKHPTAAFRHAALLAGAMIAIWLLLTTLSAELAHRKIATAMPVRNIPHNRSLVKAGTSRPQKDLVLNLRWVRCQSRVAVR